MTQRQLVIPEPDSFGFRVNRATPLAHVVAVLRRANPDAPYGELRVAAERLRLGVEMSREPRPDRFDSGTSGAEESSPAPEAVADPARLAEIEEGKPKRADVVAWAQAQQPPVEVPAKGFLPAAVLVAYRAAMREEYLASLVPVVNSDGSPAEPMPADAPIAKVH